MSNIEWTDKTWSPITGCTKISAGCVRCYAERMANRLYHMGKPKYANKFNVTLHPNAFTNFRKNLKNWNKKNKHYKIFVCSMSDIFHKDVPYTFIKKIFNEMNENQGHTFQILTKRSKRLKLFSDAYPELFTKNIWVGVTVENMDNIYRVDHLIETNAKIKFLSCEPLLGVVGFNHQQLTKLDWIIAGGETQPGARHCKEQWIRHIRDQCQSYKIPFFFKAWGGNSHTKKINGRLLDGEEYNEMPKVGDK